VFDDHRRLLDDLELQLPLLKDMADAIIACIEKEHQVYVFGNGGSAADAQHIAAELVGRFRKNRRALPAIAMTTDTSSLLSIGNDYGFAHVFSRQVEAFVRPDDVVWALSTSGNSSNVIEAVKIAADRGASIIGFTGETGGHLKPLCNYCLCVPHGQAERVQEIHQIAYHLICEAVEKHFA
jgi:D-sedoheptulose 7-phosphate isomerase